MRFFSSLGRAVVNAKRAVCRTVGVAIEKVGEITGNIDIKFKGIEIQCNNPVLEKAVDLDDYNTSVQDTIDIHKMCEEVRLDVAAQAKKYEDDLVDQIEDDINSFIDVLSEIFPESVMEQFDYEISDAFVDDIHNTIADYVASNISQDSQEFVDILKIKNDADRAQKTDKYMKNVLKNAEIQLEKKCQNKKIAVYRKMCADLQEYFENEKNIVEEYKKNMEEIQEHINDAEYCEKQAVSIIKDLSYMECIRTLTYADA